jgi:hypothetical protein
MKLERAWFPVALLAAACAMPQSEPAAAPSPTSFATPQEAMDALIRSADDPAHADALLGPDGADVLCNCDADDSDDLALVRYKMQEQVKFADEGPDLKRVLLGSEEWELPLPLVRSGDRWHFDVQTGKDEILSRSIGFNELHAIATLRELVDAQREYSAATRDGEKFTYAQKWSSTPGARDGLHWAADDQQPESPVGPRLCCSTATGSDPCESAPSQGYCIRIVKTQGEHASGGAKSYVDGRGRLTEGFAFVAWPIEYGATGVMTFQVNHFGIVYQKDLGEQTAEAAERIAAFDPDTSWDPVRD